jgi:hypothetical protein
MSYAANTTVSEAKSRAEIEQTIRSHVGRDASYSYGTMAGRAAIQFSAYGRQIKFELPLPSREDAEKRAGRKNSRRPPTEGQITEWLEQEDRRRWRCMLLIIKAKFEAVELKLELAETETERASIFEQEFLGCIVVGHEGQTLYQAIQEIKVGGQRLLPPVAHANVVDINEAHGADMQAREP